MNANGHEIWHDVDRVIYTQHDMHNEDVKKNMNG